MRYPCSHCGQPFLVKAEQLGTKCRCPHCQQVVSLPAAEEQVGEETDHLQPAAPFDWVTNSVSGLVSLVFHLLVVLLLAYCGWNTGAAGIGDEVTIGELPLQALQRSQDESLDTQPVKTDQSQETDETLEAPAPEDASSDAAVESFSVDPASPAGDSGSFDLGAVSIGGDGGGGDWGGMIRGLQRNGLDIVLVFDSTGSMGGEIDEVKRQIGAIGNTLMALVPKARVSICTYRDEGDEYVVRGSPLTSDLQAVHDYLRPIVASGGGDYQEAVNKGLRWAVQQNDFRPQARKVVLLFGDAPPHPQDQGECLRLASDFNRQHQGYVSTVTCRNSKRLAEFVEIAEVGGGEAFLTSDRRQIMTQLMVLVFGSKYRSKVIEAFRLLGE